MGRHPVPRISPNPTHPNCPRMRSTGGTRHWDPPASTLIITRERKCGGARRRRVPGGGWRWPQRLVPHGDDERLQMGHVPTGTARSKAWSHPAHHPFGNLPPSRAKSIGKTLKPAFRRLQDALTLIPTARRREILMPTPAAGRDASMLHGWSSPSA